MPLEQSAGSAFVRPRQEQQKMKVAEKVQTDRFYGAKRAVRTEPGVNANDLRIEEMNNNESSLKGNVKHQEQINSTGIPRRNFAKTPEAEQSSRLHREVQKRDGAEKSSPRARRKLPSAPVASSIRPRTPGNSNEVTSKIATPDHSRRSTPERSSQLEKSRTPPENSRKTPENFKSKSESVRKTPESSRRSGETLKRTGENLRKSGENLRKTPENGIKSQESSLSRKNSDSSDKGHRVSKIQEGGLTLNRKSSDPIEAAKSRGILGGIKYNSLPRRHQSKTRSKFYLDIEGEETLQAETKEKSSSNDKDDALTNGKTPLENGVENKTSSLTRNGKFFGNYGLKSMTNGTGGPAPESNGQELQQTHVALYKFIPRHKDELMLDEGDPLHVSKSGEDLWFEGTNLVSGKCGIFPSRYAADILSGAGQAAGMNAEDQQFFLRVGEHFDPMPESFSNVRIKVGEHFDPMPESFSNVKIKFLGSVEVADYKGDEILCYAISKIVNQRAMLSSNTPPACTLQVSSRGIRVCDFDEKQGVLKSSPKAPRKNKGRDKEKEKQKDQRESQQTPTHFFSLKNVTFCGNHPRDRRYFGFITKHPDDHRFACHVFMSKYSTDPVAQAVGDCFKKFYTQYLDYRAPTEDIYME